MNHNTNAQIILTALLILILIFIGIPLSLLYLRRRPIRKELLSRLLEGLDQSQFEIIHVNEDKSWLKAQFDIIASSDQKIGKLSFSGRYGGTFQIDKTIFHFKISQIGFDALISQKRRHQTISVHEGENLVIEIQTDGGLIFREFSFTYQGSKYYLRIAGNQVEITCDEVFVGRCKLRLSIGRPGLILRRDLPDFVKLVISLIVLLR